MTTAVSYLSSTDVAMQMLGAAYIQHQCYHSNEAKTMVKIQQKHHISSAVNFWNNGHYGNNIYDARTKENLGIDIQCAISYSINNKVRSYF